MGNRDIVPQHQADRVIRAAEAAAARSIKRVIALGAEADRLLERAKWLRVHAGAARFRVTRWVIMGMAMSLETKAQARLRAIVAERKARKATHGGDGGHRSATRGRASA